MDLRITPKQLFGNLVGPRAEPVQLFIKPRLDGVIVSGHVNSESEDALSIAGQHLLFDDVRRDLIRLLPLPVTALAIERVGRVYRGVVESDGELVLFAVDSSGFKLRDAVNQERARDLFRELTDKEIEATQEFQQQLGVDEHARYVAELMTPQEIQKSLTDSIRFWQLRKAEGEPESTPPGQRKHKPYFRRDPRTGRMEYVKGRNSWDTLVLKTTPAVENPTTAEHRKVNKLHAELMAQIQSSGKDIGATATGAPALYAGDVVEHLTTGLKLKDALRWDRDYDAAYDKVRETFNLLHKHGAWTSHADAREEQEVKWKAQQKQWNKEDRIYKQNKKESDRQTRQQQAEARGNHEYLEKAFPKAYAAFGKRLMVTGLLHCVDVVAEGGEDRRYEPSKNHTGIVRKPNGFLTTVTDEEAAKGDRRVRLHLEQIEKLPPHILDAMKRLKLTFWVSSKSAAETDGEYSSRKVNPTGYGSDDTYMNCGGFFNGYTRMIVCGAAQYVGTQTKLDDQGLPVMEKVGDTWVHAVEKTVDYYAQRSTVAHEVGHAVGGLLQMRLHLSANRTPFKLLDENPFNAEDDAEAHAAFNFVKQWSKGVKENGEPIRQWSRGDLYRALLEHTKEQYEGTDRQLHKIAQQYYDHLTENAAHAEQIKYNNTSVSDWVQYETWDDSPELVEHHKRLFNKVSPYLQQEGPGGARGRQEMLAEGFMELWRNGEEAAVARFDQPFVDWLKMVNEHAKDLKMWSPASDRIASQVAGTMKNKKRTNRGENIPS